MEVPNSTFRCVPFTTAHFQLWWRNLDSAKFPATVKFASTLWIRILVSAKVRKQHLSSPSELVMRWLEKETDWGSPNDMSAAKGGILDTINTFGFPDFDGTDANLESWRVQGVC